jgi:cytoskeletal protein RodZ
MRNTVRNLGLSAILFWGSAAWAQQTPPADAPAIRPDDAQGTASAAGKAPKNPKATAQSEAGEPRANTSDPRADSQEPARAAPAAPKTANSKPAAPKTPNANDKLQLGTATVTGDREQPKVMYVVPWKKPDIGDPEGKPMNSLVDEILSPVDRDVFKREVSYYQTVKSQASQNGAPPAAGQAAEKVEK